MTGGLKTINRYLLAGAGVIGIFAAAPEAKAQSQSDMQQIQAQIQEMQAANRQMQETMRIFASYEKALTGNSPESCNLP
jgi:glucokinase